MQIENPALDPASVTSSNMKPSIILVFHFGIKHIKYILIQPYTLQATTTTMCKCAFVFNDAHFSIVCMLLAVS